MVLELQAAPALASAQEISIAQFGAFPLVDFNPKEGYVYQLSAQTLKHISHAVVFAAKFESSLVRSAIMDIALSKLTFTLEIAKNSRPLDVALRYAAEHWVNNDTARVDQSRKPGLKSIYTARSLPDNALSLICEQLKIKTDELNLFQIRINFKDQTAALITDQAHSNKLPSGGFQSITVAQGTASLTPSQNGENMTLSSSAQNFASSAPASVSEPVKTKTTSDWKYTTYSQSEVDRLLKIQAENITSSLTAKISSQQKSYQEGLFDQQTALSKIAEQLTAQMEAIAAKIERKSDLQLEKSQTIFEKSQNEFEVQLEQFQVDVDRSLSSDLKGFDKRIQELENSVKALQQPKNDNSQLVLILAALALVISVVNTIIFFAHH